MKSSRKVPVQRIFIIMVIVSVIGLGCLCPAVSTPTAVPTTRPKTPTATEGAYPVTAVPNLGLNLSGPWMLIATDYGLWAANPDGYSLTQLTWTQYLGGDLAKAIQPGGSKVVVLSSDEGDPYHHLALSLLSLPGGSLQKITDLTTAQTEPGPDDFPGSMKLEAVRAIAEQGSYAWSPDGTKLAFIGVMDGPSADVYLYDVNTNQVSRVSNDDAQDFSPTWSPDGQHLLWFGAEGFGTGAGMTMKGVWSSRGDGSNVTWLYATDSAGEELIGWWDNQTVVMDTWTPVCGPSRLRLFNIVDMNEKVLTEDCFSGAAVADFGGSINVAFGTSNGLFRYTLANAEPQVIVEIQVTAVWLNQPGNMFVVRYIDNSLATYYWWADDFTPEVAPATVNDVTMFGIIWGWTSVGEAPGVWISGPGINIGQIFDGPAIAPIFHERDNTLFFFSPGQSVAGLYAATFANYYNDAHWVVTIPGTVLDVEWVGSFW